MGIVTRMAILEGVTMDNYEIERMIAEVSRSLEDLTYRMYVLEESLADMSAYLEEQKEESVDV